MELPENFLEDLAYQLVQHRGVGEETRKSVQKEGDKGLITWSFLNLDPSEKAKATLDLLAARDLDTSLTKLACSIDKFNQDSGRLYKALNWLTGVIAFATVVSAALLAWQIFR